ncbi:hypothetical protein SAMN05216436_106147 [bacterium A37T11]|nr:hypothetical protein SAMN05216436_106147 [bacterium A37T11]
MESQTDIRLGTPGNGRWHRFVHWLKHIRISQEAAYLIISCLCTLLFLYSGGIKLMEYDKFMVQLGQSILLKGFVGFIAWFIPGLELIIAGVMIYGIAQSEKIQQIGLQSFFILMILFTVYILAILCMGKKNEPCACGGVIGEVGGWQGHFAFNLAFLCISFRAIHLSRKKTVCIILLSGLLIFLLYIRVDANPNHRFARFKRHIIPLGLAPVDSINLRHPGYYIAGEANGEVYLGRYKAFDQVIRLGQNLNDSSHIRLNLPSLDYRSVKLTVQAPYFYLSDGDNLWIYRGIINDWTAKLYMDSIRFLSALPLSSGTMTLYTMKQYKNVLAKTSHIQGKPILFTNLLKEQGGEGMFSTDGKLIYNPDRQRLVFIYNYRNEYLVMDTAMNLLHQAHTIDTISQVQLRVGHNVLDGQYVLQQSLLVNIAARTNGDHLYVQSNLLSAGELPEDFDNHTVIDVYDYEQSSYLYSFYIPDESGQKVRDFIVTDTQQFISLQGNKLLRYLLPDEKEIMAQKALKENLAREQEKGSRTPVKKEVGIH